MILKPLKGIDRPAIATLLPTQKGFTILLDAGANVDCKSTQLFQFGIMGNVFAKCMFGKPSPAVGLLAIGEEDTKGNDVTREAFMMLKQSHLNFIGNVEGKYFFRGVADVVVCDGFIGNIALKMCEGLAEMYGQSLKAGFTKTLWRRLGALLLRPALNDIRQRVDASEYGGAPLLGVNGTCIIGHGSSTPKAIKNAIHMAKRFLEERVTERIQEDIERNSDIQEAGATRSRRLWRHIRSHMSFRGERDREDGVGEVDEDLPSSHTPIL
jgi:glycerol-3-phosphate acyltransferase PlsX